MKKILIIEDELVTRKILYTILSGDYNLNEAEDAEKGLEIIESDFNPDMIICDLNLPGMSGMEFLKKVNLKKIPFVMLTIDNDRQKKEEGKNLGLTGWMVKPFSPESVKAMVKKILKDDTA